MYKNIVWHTRQRERDMDADGDALVLVLKQDNLALMHALDGLIQQLNCNVIGVAKSIENPGDSLYMVRVEGGGGGEPSSSINCQYMEQQAIQSVLLTRYNALAYRQKLAKNTARR